MHNFVPREFVRQLLVRLFSAFLFILETSIDYSLLVLCKQKDALFGSRAIAYTNQVLKSEKFRQDPRERFHVAHGTCTEKSDFQCATGLGVLST